MHMSDALISPIVGGGMLATSSGLMGYSIRNMKMDDFEKKLPLMGVMGAFLFAAQMINFSIPGTGSSGHIGGGMLLAIILGPAASFLTMACVLLIQALFFADGGLLALGCNLVNLGFFTAFIAYPFVFKKIIGTKISKGKLMVGSIIAVVIGLQLGSFAVVIETVISGRTEIPILTFLLFMQPIHLAIGIVEGVVTGLIVNYLYSQNSEMIYSNQSLKSEDFNKKRLSVKVLFITLLLSTFFIGGIISLYASGNPDGLEWAIEKTQAKEIPEHSSPIVNWLEKIQEKTALLPEYDFAGDAPIKEAGTSISGIVGSLITLLIVLILGLIIRKAKRRVNYNE